MKCRVHSKCVISKCSSSSGLKVCSECADAIHKESPEAIEYLKKLNDLGKGDKNV